MKKLIVFMVLGAVLALAGAVYVGQALGYFSSLGQPTVFLVNKGDNFVAVSKRLEAQGVIKSARALRWYHNLVPHGPLHRGEFALTTNMPVPAVVSALTEGKPIEYKFTIPEGQNIFQVGELLEEKGFVKKGEFLEAAFSSDLIKTLPGFQPGDIPPRSIEGYIFPDTYLLQKIFTAKEIAQMMVAHFREVYKSLEPELQTSLVMNELRLTPYQFITLASIVEKETGNVDERPVIASIFVNRLRKKMRLQTDPTVIYGLYLKNKGTWNGNITRRDLNEEGPYNSYQIAGLPPGPIANPGISALKAVLKPANTDYLYFVSRGDGTSIFSREYGAHSKAVRDTQLAPRKNGKSWRDLAPEKRAK